MVIKNEIHIAVSEVNGLIDKVVELFSGEMNFEFGDKPEDKKDDEMQKKLKSVLHNLYTIRDYSEPDNIEACGSEAAERRRNIVTRATITIMEALVNELEDQKDQK